MTENYAVVLQNIKKDFQISRANSQSLFKKNTHIKNVLVDVNLSIKKGEIFGIVGRNGSGKSTLLKIMSGIMYPDKGSVNLNGKVVSILELGMGFHPDLSGKENIYVKGSTYGMSEKEIDLVIDDIIDFSGLGDQINDPIRTYSSGMYARLAFSIASHVNSDIVIIDEILSVGDAEFNIKCKNAFDRLKKDNKTVILTSHSTGTLESVCDRVAWIEKGIIEECGLPIQICSIYNKNLTESPLIIRDCAINGDPQSQNKMGIMYRDGVGVKKDASEAIRWFIKAVDSGSIDAMLNLADYCYNNGDISQAIKYYEMASKCGNSNAICKLMQIRSSTDCGAELIKSLRNFADNGNIRACSILGCALFCGNYIQQNLVDANFYLKKAAEGGDINSMIYLASNYRSGMGIQKDYEMSQYWFKKAACCGNSVAAIELARAYNTGSYGFVSIPDAIHWYECAAKLGNQEAMYQLGIMYRDGLGTEIDLDKSDAWFDIYSKCGMHDLEYQLGSLIFDKKDELNKEMCIYWFEKAAEGNNSNAQWQLGVLYRDGTIVDQNYDLSIQWLTKAAEKWHPFALVDLSNMYFNGQGVDKNPEIAFELMYKAAISGNSSARCVVGMMLRDGIGTSPNLELALNMFELSAEYGNIYAIETLSNM